MTRCPCGGDLVRLTRYAPDTRRASVKCVRCGKVRRSSADVPYETEYWREQDTHASR